MSTILSTDDRSRPCFPLAPITEQRLALVLLAEDGASRREQFAEALTGDPLLTYCLVCRHRNQFPDEVPSHEALLSYLAQHCLEAIGGVLNEDAGEPDHPPAAIIEAATLVALVARALAHERNECEANAYFLGQNLSVAASLSDAKLVFSASADAPAMASVEAAMAMIEKKGKANILDAKLMASFRRRAADVARRWEEAGDLPAVPLPSLLAQQLRLKELETEFDRLLATEKLRAMKELAYGAGHEINNPLANIATRAQALLRDETDPERRRKLANINSQAFRAHEMIADLMLFAKPPKLEPKPTNLAALVDTLFKEFRDEASSREIELVRTGADAPEVIVDPIQIAVALKGMIQNSLEAIGHAGKIEIEVQSSSEAGAEKGTGVFCAKHPSGRSGKRLPSPFPPPGGARVVVRDTGPGIADDVRPHIFDPFYSGREAGRGLGFGLTKAWRVVDDHGGSIHVDCPTTGGVVFTIDLPKICSNGERQSPDPGDKAAA